MENTMELIAKALETVVSSSCSQILSWIRNSRKEVAFIVTNR